MDRRRFLQGLSSVIVGLGLQPIPFGFVHKRQNHIRCAYLGPDHPDTPDLLAAEYLLIDEIEFPEEFIVTRSIEGKNLWLYSKEQWARIRLNLENSDLDLPLNDAIIRCLIAPAIQSTAKDNRMIIPDCLMEYAQFGTSDLTLTFDGIKGVLTKCS